MTIIFLGTCETPVSAEPQGVAGQYICRQCYKYKEICK
jgi:hypothetical protein